MKIRFKDKYGMNLPLWKIAVDLIRVDSRGMLWVSRGDRPFDKYRSFPPDVFNDEDIARILPLLRLKK
jgi:hypothetical protein